MDTISHREKNQSSLAAKKLADIIHACAEAKGREICILDVSDVFDLSEYFVVVSGRSDRQVQGISNRINEAMNGRSEKAISIEGYDDGHWILLDYDEVIVHVFYEPVREHYDIEGLWTRARKLKPEAILREAEREAA